MRCIVDSCIEYVSHRKAVTTQETKETGHYICYKFVNGTLLRFDDALVNRVDMLSQYHINLILYRHYDIDPYKWDVDLGFVAHLNQITYGLRRTPIHGTRYSVWHKDMTQDEWHANGSVIDDNQIADNVVTSPEQPLDMMKGNTTISADSVISHDQPLDMSVSINNVDVNRTECNVENSQRNTFEGSAEDKNESDEVNTVDNSNVSEMQTLTNDVQHEDSLLDQQNTTEGTVGSSDNSNV